MAEDLTDRVRIRDEHVLSRKRYKLSEYDIDYRRNDGTWQSQTREIFDRKHAAAVLPIDPARGTVILVSQFRLPAFLTGHKKPLVEVIAGALDNDAPDVCARREAMEEAGIEVSDLKKVFHCFMSPGAIHGAHAPHLRPAPTAPAPRKAAGCRTKARISKFLKCRSMMHWQWSSAARSWMQRQSRFNCNSRQAGRTCMTRVVVIGAGFAGIEVARCTWRRARISSVTLIDRQNHHLFQPLLYQVATAALSPADIAEPIRKMLRGHPSVEVVLGEVSAIDTAARAVTLSHGESIGYDILILATGATHGYFGHDEWERFAPGLKTIEDARKIRSHLLLTFEQAEMSRDPAEQKRLMTIAVIGGGPTGVELAGSIAELARYTLAKDFHRIRAETATVLLLEAGPRACCRPRFPKTLSHDTYAVRKPDDEAGRRYSGEHRRPVEQITAIAASLSAGETIGVGFAIWAAGVMASKLGQFLGVDLDRAGRVRVNADLSVPSQENVYVLGDLGLAMDGHGKPLPGLARKSPSSRANLSRPLAGEKIQHSETPKPFVFHNRGNTAITRGVTPRCSISDGRE